MNSVATPASLVLLLMLSLTSARMDFQEVNPAGPAAQPKEFSPATPREELYLHVDREKYIAGEDIWFSIYNIDRETGNLFSGSVVVYVELLNPMNNPVIQTRLALSGGRGEGNFLLPDTLCSGTYTIRAYTNLMKNFLPGNCYMHNIDLYNPFKNSDFRRKVDLTENQQVSTALNSNPGPLNVSAESIYGRREKVSLKLGINKYDAGRSGIYQGSISVAPAEVSALSNGIDDYMIFGSEAGKTVPKQYLSESDGHYLSVMLKYRDGNRSDSSDFLYMSVQGKVAEFRYAERDSAGRFSFLLPVDNKLRTLILQPEHANNNMILEIEPSFSWKLPSVYSFRDTLAEQEPDVFSELSFNYQAAKIYGTKLRKESEADENTNPQKGRFYGIPEMEIFTDDYIRLPSMQEVFFELLPGIIIRSGRSGYYMQITNPLTGVFYNEPPLVMIDGVIINDLTVLVDLNPEMVEKIEVVKTPYLIGDLILHGIVNVITRTGNFSNITMPDYAVILPYRVVDKPAIFISPDYSDEQRRESRTPDLRNTLYWNPSVKTNSNGEAEIEFWTSDLPGTYIISVQCISATGEKVSVRKSITVR